MSLRDLNQISIERDISETPQKHLKKDVVCVTSLRLFEHISKNMSIPWRLLDVSEISLTSISDFSKIHPKMALFIFRRVIEVSDKIDVGPLKTPMKWNVS